MLLFIELYLSDVGLCCNTIVFMDFVLCLFKLSVNVAK